MNNDVNCGLEDLFEVFDDSVTPAQVLSAKLNAQISSTITTARVKFNMSQKSFASYLGVSQSLISRWECGDCNFSINKLSEIVCKLNMSVNMEIFPVGQQAHKNSFAYGSKQDYSIDNNKNLSYKFRKYNMGISNEIIPAKNKVSKEENNYVAIC